MYRDEPMNNFPGMEDDYTAAQVTRLLDMTRGIITCAGLAADGAPDDAKAAIEAADALLGSALRMLKALFPDDEVMHAHCLLVEKHEKALKRRREKEQA